MPSIHVEEPVDEVNNTEQADKQETEHTQKRLRFNALKHVDRRKIIFVAVALVVVLGFLLKTNNEKRQLEQELAQLSSQQNEAQNEAQELKAEVSRFMELPSAETPTVATVVDAEKVRNQSFFKNSQNGDKILLFASSGKAILYRPTTKKIIEVTPISLGQGQAQNAASTEQ